jgi:hypothetical protein
MIQLIFYLLTAIYLYRTMNLFIGKEAALMGASVYLFSPLIFHYASLAEMGCGTVFFIVLISYYFLRYTKYTEVRDLLLTSFFIGIGFLYKRDILLMFFICSAYFFTIKITKKDTSLRMPIKILLLALIPAIPWLIIGKYFSLRNLEIIWSHLLSFDMLTSYLLLLPSQVSWIIFFLFIASVNFMLFARKTHLTMFFGLLFIAYYLFYTADSWVKVDRFSMAFYPTIAVFLGQFISSIVNKINWKHSFNLTFSLLTIYLILICTIWKVSPINASYVMYRNIDSIYYPSDKAMKWVKDNIRDGEKILTLQIVPAVFYRDKYDIDRDRLFYYGVNINFPELSSPQKLKAFCNKNKITHIMFIHGYNPLMSKSNNIIRYLKENLNSEFIEVMKFNLGNNFIYIYKLSNKFLA